jgi:putative ABC transport system permease protein
MVPIAQRNLFHDKVKLATALVGVVFSVILVTCLGGLYVNSSKNASGIVDNAGGDLWIVARGTQSVEMGEPISKRRLYQALAMPGVLWAEPLLVQFSQWRLPDGRQEIAQIVGLEPNTRLNLPWGMAEGKRESIRHDNGVILDERERGRFGVAERPLQVGDQGEIFNTRVRIAGFSQGVGSFTTIPYVFMTEGQARRCTMIEDGQTKFVVVKVSPDLSVAEVQERLTERMPDVDVLTTEQFSKLSRDYWLFGTGVGMGILFAATLGLIVGSVIVSQTVYASTLDRLGEYGTLKALGISNQRLASIIVQQALLIGVMGYAAGAVFAALLSQKMPEWHLPVEIPVRLYVGSLLITLVTCAAASITSVAKVFRLPPATVFRG